MKMAQTFRICKDTVNSCSGDYEPSMRAPIWYSTMFSLARLLVLVIAIAGMAFGAEVVWGQIASEVSAPIRADTAPAIEAEIESASHCGNGWWASALTVVLLMASATSVFAKLQSALDRIWLVPESKNPPASGASCARGCARWD